MRGTLGRLPHSPCGRWLAARTATPWLSLALVVPAAAIALSRGFDGLYGQDAYAYFDYATGSVRDSIAHLKPLEPFFWPPGYPLIVALVSLVVGPTPLAGQLVSLAAGASVPVTTAWLARELWPGARWLAWVSGLLVAACGQLWQSSVVVMADTTGLALATCGAVALVRYARSRALGWLLAASAALAYAMLTRWIYGLVAIPLGVYLIWHRPPIKHTLAALALAGALLAPVLGPPLIGLMVHPRQPAAFAGNLQVYSWSPLNAFQRDFVTADGHLAYSQRNGVYYATAPANLAFFGQLLAPWALVGLWVAVRAWSRPTFVLVVGWAATVYAFHAGAPWQNFRFTLAYLPPLAILVAFGLTWTWHHLPTRLQPLVTGCAGLGLLAASLGGVRLVEGFVDRKDDDLALAHWVVHETHAEPGARLLSFGPTLTLQHYTHLPTFDLFDLAPTDLTMALQAGTTYVLVDEGNVATQWLDTAPATNLARLKNCPGMEALGMYGGYTLFRIGPGCA